MRACLIVLVNCHPTAPTCGWDGMVVGLRWQDSLESMGFTVGFTVHKKPSKSFWSLPKM